METRYVKDCKNCGHIVDMDTTKCPECGCLGFVARAIRMPALGDELSPPPPIVIPYDGLRDKYLNDAGFHELVEVLRAFVSGNHGGFSMREMRQALDMAEFILKEEGVQHDGQA